MTAVVLVIHLILAVAMIGVVLLQKSEGGGLGIGGGGMSGFMTGRSTANLLTRTTAILAAGFFATSIALAFLAGTGGTPRSIMDRLPPASGAPAAPAPGAPANSAPATPAAPSSSPAPAPAQPATPSVPLAK
ncbi:MAG TPA: preprotein translocase subunit SecG [Stellaceae bacterium]|nr:preprotein translocase subunit SecG [Stellaceae bacterium]